MEDKLIDANSSLDSIVVLSGSETNTSFSSSSANTSNNINCIIENERSNYSQRTLLNSFYNSSTKLNDTGSSSFIATNAETECFLLEKEIQTLKQQLATSKQENLFLKQNCEFLKKEVEKLESKANIKADSNSSDYLDFDSVLLGEKFQNFLTETNKLMSKNDLNKFKESFIYLIKNLWSSIAFKCDDKNLENLRQTRDDLINKIDNLNIEIVDNDKIEFLNNELDQFKRKYESIKLKLNEQNEFLKLIVKKIGKENKNAQVVESRKEVNDPNVFYCYNVNDYITIDNNIGLRSELDDAEPTRTKEKEEQKEQKQEQVQNFDDKNFYKCPTCQTTVDSSSVSFDMYQAHVEVCDDSHLVCMFCLCWFQKNQETEYLKHIDFHLKKLHQDLKQANFFLN